MTEHYDINRISYKNEMSVHGTHNAVSGWNNQSMSQWFPVFELQRGILRTHWIHMNSFPIIARLKPEKVQLAENTPAVCRKAKADRLLALRDGFEILLD